MSMRWAGYPMRPNLRAAMVSAQRSGGVVGGRPNVGVARDARHGGAGDGGLHRGFRLGFGLGASVGGQRGLAPLPDELSAGYPGDQRDKTHPGLVEPVTEE